ncbi:MAG: hypothetical protein WBP08_02390, partial [Saprospiraceae bacterium]
PSYTSSTPESLQLLQGLSRFTGGIDADSLFCIRTYTKKIRARASSENFQNSLFYVPFQYFPSLKCF